MRRGSQYGGEGLGSSREEVRRRSIKAREYSAENQLYNSSEYVNKNDIEESPAISSDLNVGSDATQSQRRKSKNLMNSYSTANGGKTTATSILSASLMPTNKYGRGRKASQFENVLPKVNTFNRGGSGNQTVGAKVP